MNNIAFSKYKDLSYQILLFVVIIISIFFRFYQYSQRWGLAYDQAHDAVVANYALQTGTIPLVGPFSSAGPFQTGGEWYWIIMFASLFPFAGYMSPWIIMTFVSVCFVYTIIIFAKNFFGKWFGLLIGLLAAVSPSQIAQSVNLTNQSPLAILSLLTLWFGIALIKTKKISHAFFLGFFACFAATVHLQGALLFIVVIVSHFLEGLNIRKIVSTSIGIFFPLVPLLYFDLLYEGVNSKGFLYYLCCGQQSITYDALGRRWVTFLSYTIPQEWAKVSGGNVNLTLFAILLLVVLFCYEIVKKKISKEISLIIISFLLMLIAVRYTRTPLFSSYFNFLHPYIFLLTAYLLYKSIIYHKVLGIIFTIIFIFTTIHISTLEFSDRENITHRQINVWINSLKTVLPNQRYRVYDLAYRYRDKSVPFVLVASSKNTISDNGYPIGIGISTSSDPVNAPILVGENLGYQIFDLATFSGEMLSQNNWVFINPSEIYRSTQDWPKK